MLPGCEKHSRKAAVGCSCWAVRLRIENPEEVKRLDRAVLSSARLASPHRSSTFSVAMNPNTGKQKLVVQLTQAFCAGALWRVAQAGLRCELIWPTISNRQGELREGPHIE